MEISSWIFVILAIVIGPGLTVGVIRKIKARLQNRIGAPIFQPLLDCIKLLRKGETLSVTASWVFRFSSVLSVAITLYLAMIMPWLSPKPLVTRCDLFQVVYLLAAIRFFALLAALDTGSAFGAFAASRETTLSFLVEPSVMLSLASLAVVAGSSDLNVVFGSSQALQAQPGLWLLAGTALLIASLVELSRMPVDDPTTHLELTMVHEAMILEASGKNLALFEYATLLKMLVLFGLSAQCLIHAFVLPDSLSSSANAALSISSLLLVAGSVGVFESLAVKLNWRKAPEFIGYSLTLSFIAVLIALGVKPT